MASLTQDIIEDILLRLPVKSLIRFKCVCKQWFSLITDPTFAKWHLAQATNDEKYMDRRRLSIFIYTRNQAAANVSPSVYGRVVGNCNGMVCTDYEFNTSIYTPVRRDVVVDTRFHLFGRRVVGSCDGLICVVQGFNTFYLWNPSTREHKTLPRPTVVHAGRSFGGRLIYGLGYDSSTDDYKMFRGCYSRSRRTTEVFSLKTNSWRRIHQEFPSGYYPHSRSSVLINEALHWTLRRLRRNDGANFSNGVVSFDLKEERFKELALPDETRAGSCPTLGVLGGDLAMIQHLSDGSHQVWRMQEYGVNDSWIKLIRLPPCSIAAMAPFDHTREGDIVVLINEMELAIYNSRREALENVALVVPQCNYRCRVALYVESLISPNYYG